jgi:hypothetical protein
MRKILLFLCLMVAMISISACSAKQEPIELKVSKSSDVMGRENYKKAISELKKTGFTNIKTKALDDLITGWLTKDGEIEKIEINGETEFKANDSFPKDSKIVITYHTFPKREKRDSKATDEKSSEKSDTNSTDKKSSEKRDTNSTDKKSVETAKQSTNYTPAKSNQGILTVKNNADLAAVLAVKDEFDPIVGEFAKKYAGKTIEFDGNIADMMPHGNYKTRYDILIYPGDYNETTAIGPSFQFKDVNVVYDLKLTGSNIPETIGRGQNLHITAVVEEYNENNGLFFLKPVSTEIR